MRCEIRGRPGRRVVAQRLGRDTRDTSGYTHLDLTLTMTLTLTGYSFIEIPTIFHRRPPEPLRPPLPLPLPLPLPPPPLQAHGPIRSRVRDKEELPPHKLAGSRGRRQLLGRQGMARVTLWLLAAHRGNSLSQSPRTWCGESRRGAFWRAYSDLFSDPEPRRRPVSLR